MKGNKSEKIPITECVDDVLAAVEEMFMLIAEQFVHTGPDLKYFGKGRQIKISKLADNLYSTLKEVLIFVIADMAKESNVDFKFQVPKHTSFVGTIVKSVCIDVIAHSPEYCAYVDKLCDSPGKYLFDTAQDTFVNLYRDTVYKLNERGYLFERDPELNSIQNGIKQLDPLQPIGTLSISPEHILPQEMISENMHSDSEAEDGEKSEADDAKSIFRMRVILPYMRRLFETRKAAIVTRKRIEAVRPRAEPDEEIRTVFQQKLNEQLEQNQNIIDVNSETFRFHCIFMALKYVKENFSKERVEVLEAFLKNEKMSATKHRKRYVKVPSGKRQHIMDSLNDMVMAIPQDNEGLDTY